MSMHRPGPDPAWREALGDDAEAAWHAMGEEPMPARRVEFERRTVLTPAMGWAVAATLLLAVMATWNMRLHGQVEAAQLDYASALLRVESSTAQLTALSLLNQRELSGPLLEQVTAVVLQGRDPNVQLAALDLLLARDIATASQLERRIQGETRYNRNFLKASLQARETEQIGDGNDV